MIEPPLLIQVPETLPEEPIVEETVDDLEDSEDLEQTFEPADDGDEQDSEPEAGIAVQFSNDFPHLAGAQTGCYGLDNCRRVDGQNYKEALQSIRENLEAQGYVLTPYEGNDDSDVRNHRIYEMRLPEDSEADVKYLNVFGEGLKAAIYIITLRLITPAELQALTIN